MLHAIKRHMYRIYCWAGLHFTKVLIGKEILVILKTIKKVYSSYKISEVTTGEKPLDGIEPKPPREEDRAHSGITFISNILL